MKKKKLVTIDQIQMVFIDPQFKTGLSLHLPKKAFPFFLEKRANTYNNTTRQSTADGPFHLRGEKDGNDDGGESEE